MRLLVHCGVETSGSESGELDVFRLLVCLAVDGDVAEDTTDVEGAAGGVQVPHVVELVLTASQAPEPSPGRLEG